jgi:hypothetical protein
MQTVCAHCYVRLSHRQQRTACILCTKCEQHWTAGKPLLQGRKLPEWLGNFGLPFSRENGGAHAPS